MLKAPDPKKIVAALLVKGKADHEQDDDDEGPKPLEAAAQDVLDAVKEGDAASFAESLKAFVDLCADHGDEDQE